VEKPADRADHGVEYRRMIRDITGTALAAPLSIPHRILTLLTILPTPQVSPLARAAEKLRHILHCLVLQRIPLGARCPWGRHLCPHAR
jgi:hypothetical protein